MPKYQCVQFGLCSRADACEEFEIKAGDSFQCARGSPDPGCREQLVEIRGGRLPPQAKMAIIAVPIAAVLGLCAWMLIGLSEADAQHKARANVEQLLIDVWPWLKSTQ
jgi:hypothetical protein